MNKNLKSPRSGFSLLEVLVVLAILTLIAGAAVPVLSRVIDREARRVTGEELELLASGALEYVRDTGQLPLAAAGLGVDPGVAGWSGPYVGSLGTDSKSGLPAHEVDGWSRAYRFRIQGSLLTIDSPGSDGVFGNGDDLLVRADAAVIWREQTLALLKVLNQAVLNYNAVYQASDPLPGDWSQALSRLVLRGYLPSSAGFQTDAFGAPFVGVPQGMTPMVQVGSIHVGS